jgi:tripartite-type tricarboxylate transporter receptor subunit TctC
MADRPDPRRCKALALPEVKEKFSNAGSVEPWVTAPEEFAAEIRDEYAKYAKLVKNAGAKLD